VPTRSSADPRRRLPRTSGPRRPSDVDSGNPESHLMTRATHVARSRPTRARATTSETTPCRHLEIEPGETVGFYSEIPPTSTIRRGVV